RAGWGGGGGAVARGGGGGVFFGLHPPPPPRFARHPLPRYGRGALWGAPPTSPHPLGSKLNSTGDPMPTLHPQIVKALEAMEKLGLKPIEAMTPVEARAQREAPAQSRKAEPLPVGRVEERTIPGPAGPIRVRCYWPNASGPVPAIAYYHGGGHVIGSLDTHDLIARNLCAGAAALVVSVDYRMGPEHRFPAAV